MKKILVFGSKGMLGTDVSQVLRDKGYEVYGTTHRDCDVSIWDQVISTIQDQQQMELLIVPPILMLIKLKKSKIWPLR